MSTTVTSQTTNQLFVDYDVSKIFVFDNFYKPGTLLNASGGVKSFPPGTLIGRIGSSDKLVPCASGATDGSQFPLGILLSDVVDLADAGEAAVDICISGDVVRTKVIYDDTDTQETVVALRRLKDRINADTMGINLVDSDELTGTDNS